MLAVWGCYIKSWPNLSQIIFFHTVKKVEWKSVEQEEINQAPQKYLE